MGINSEAVQLLCDLKAADQFLDFTNVLELGDQELTPSSAQVNFILNRKSEHAIKSAKQLYMHLGFQNYKVIDGTDGPNSVKLDLNMELPDTTVEALKSQLVTNFGTTEHVFNQYQVFNTIHKIVSAEGIMVHAVPISGNFQHGYFSYTPRFFAELAWANGYKILNMYISPDYKPELHSFSRDKLYKLRFKDLMLYVVFQKTNDDVFVMPYDGMFREEGGNFGYHINSNVQDLDQSEFRPFLISGSWSNLNSSSKSRLRRRIWRVLHIRSFILSFIHRKRNF